MDNDFPSMITENLHLRAVTPDDAELYHRLLSVPEVTRFTDIPDSPTQKRSERFVSWMSRLHQKGHGCAWVLEDKQTQVLMGAIRINEIHKKEKLGVLGYELHPQFWGKGLMSEALAAVVTCGHEHFSLNRLEAWTLPGNDASDRVLLKNGFCYEGTLRQKAFFKGSYQDLRMFGRIASDMTKKTLK